MADFEAAKAREVLGLSSDATFEDLDKRYLELTSHWSSLGLVDIEMAKPEQQKIDDAYKLLLPLFMEKFDDEPGLISEDYTIKQVINGQDRIQFPSTNEDDLWMPQSSRPKPSDTEGSDGRNLSSFFINEICGDIFDAPDRAVIVHAVNCQGVWGYGVAAHLKKRLPHAYIVYQAYCTQAQRPYDILGTCLLIPPQKEDYSKVAKKNQTESVSERPVKRLWVACLFTSIGYGKPSMTTNNPGKDPKEQMIRNTRWALKGLRFQLESHVSSESIEQTSTKLEDDLAEPGEIWSVKFNSGAFGVDWEETIRVLEIEFGGYERPWIVVEKEGKDKSRYKEDQADFDEDDLGSRLKRGRSKIRMTFKRGLGSSPPSCDDETGEAD
ncbi:ADP-ribose 1''-phosphate phosphatase [Knufia peltigerae]|uniref:ADP-ribose 1''-phosphate phosphatase n=1 Tax=Knufia peltigerae TaxID=1002370 RepID=A0AA38XJQ5_9EURO|nr:ADP-ribose 1''-phosphate phosphatase [Knufia peltigerae]